MFISKFQNMHTALLAGVLAFGSSAHAAVTTTYNFGTLLTASSGYAAPTSFASNPFAKLDATDNGGGVWTFMLTINNNLFSSFGNSAFLGSMSFDFIPDPINKNLKTYFIGSNQGGVDAVFGTNGTGASGLSDIDFGTAFGKGSKDRLAQSDWVTWKVTNLYPGSSLVNMYVHVQGIGSKGYSAKYTPVMAAVPEPGTYAMLIAGLGMLGFMARRKTRNA